MILSSILERKGGKEIGRDDVREDVGDTFGIEQTIDRFYAEGKTLLVRQEFKMERKGSRHPGIERMSIRPEKSYGPEDVSFMVLSMWYSSVMFTEEN